MVRNQRWVESASRLVAFPTKASRPASRISVALRPLWSMMHSRIWLSQPEVAMAAASPSIEAARIAALNRYAILDTEPEQSFDDLVILAAYVCRTPMAMLSLVDEHRQWFKSKVGVQVRETPREISFCSHAIEQY